MTSLGSPHGRGGSRLSSPNVDVGTMVDEVLADCELVVDSSPVQWGDSLLVPVLCVHFA